MKKILMFFLCFLFIFPTVEAKEISVKNTAEEVGKALIREIENPTYGEIGGEWAVIALARSGLNVPEGYFSAYYANVESHVKSVDGILDARKITEYSRLILALTAIGKDPRNVADYNLLTPLGDFEKTTFQGINGAIFALLALDSAHYPEPMGGATRAMYLEEILGNQHTDGGWGLGNSSDIDVTAMALCALGAYQETAGVEDAINRALSYISSAQNEMGGFTSFGEETPESSAWVLIALSTLGISYEDERFVKNGNSTLDYLLTFYENGIFSHQKGGESNLMSTEQALLAFAALLRAEDGKQSVFSMEDATDLVGNSDENESNRHSDVSINPVIIAGKTFSDITGHRTQREIEDLASRGIINGKTETFFDPDSTMTRAEFCTIVVRALGLPTGGEEPFSDIEPTDWFSPFVASAYRYGIVNGVGEGRFNPSGTITREEASVMVSRASALCGLEKALAEAEIMDTLTLFTDYVEVSTWAKEGVAFCYREGILSDAEMKILPKTPVLRYEIACMLWNLLNIAELI